jgi:hypothetical protein
MAENKKVRTVGLTDAVIAERKKAAAEKAKAEKDAAKK